MIFHSQWFWIGLLAMLAGCASTPGWTPLNGPALRISQPRSIEILAEKPPEFRQQQNGVPFSPLVNALRGTANDAPYDLYLFQLGLVDPGPRLGRALAASLSKKYQLEIRGIRAVEDTSPPLQSDLSLDVGTVDWALDCTGYQKPDSWSEEPPTCTIVYRARVRLTDSRSKHVVAAGDCQSAPTRQMLAQKEDPDAKLNVRLVQSGLKEAIENCTDSLRHDLLGIYGSTP